MRKVVDEPGAAVSGHPPSIARHGLATKMHSSPVIVALWVAAALNLAFVFAKLPGKESTIDFSLYYTAASGLRMGISPYTGDLDPLAARLGLNIDHQIRVPFTPPFLLVFEPLTLLSPRIAYWIWSGLNLVALAASMFVLLRPLGSSALLLGALMLLYPPLADELLFAQSQLLVLALLCLMFRCLRDRKDRSAGIALGIAGALRVYPLAVVGYLLLTRRSRALLSAVLTLAIAGAVTTAFLGWRTCLDFLSGARYALGYRYLALPTNVSVSGFVSRSFWNLAGPNPAGSVDIARHLMILIAEFAVLAFAVRATLASADDRAFSLWVACAIVLSPTAWFHYMVLLFILFAELAAAASRGMCSTRAIWAAALSYISTFVVNDIMLGLTTRYGPFYRWFGQLYFISLLLAYVSAYWLAVDRVTPAPSRAQDEDSYLPGSVRA